ncbi:hypothetical protein ACFL5Q_04810 [Planctomycetota bacterium]
MTTLESFRFRNRFTRCPGPTAVGDHREGDPGLTRSHMARDRGGRGPPGVCRRVDGNHKDALVDFGRLQKIEPQIV